MYFLVDRICLAPEWAPWMPPGDTIFLATDSRHTPSGRFQRDESITHQRRDGRDTETVREIAIQLLNFKKI